MTRSKKTSAINALEPAETLGETATEIVQDELENTEASDAFDPEILPEPDAVSEIESVEEVEQAPIESSVKPESNPKQRSGSGGLFLGGIVAAALGAGATYYVLPRVPGLLKDPAFAERVDAAQTQAKSASEQASLAGIKLDAIEPRLSSLESATGPQEALAAMEDKLRAMEGRVQELEARPVPSATASQETQDAVDRAVADMRAELGKELDAIEAQKVIATDAQNAATKAANAAAARTVFARLNAALESGQPFPQMLDQIKTEIGTPPEALQNIAVTGAPTMASLQKSFPAAARTALSDSISATQGETPKSRVGAFLRSQLGVRSLEPREGDDPDAVLSRAEASLKKGDLATALQEVVALPAEGQDALADWVSLAQTRLDAEKALAELAAQLVQ